MRGLWAEITLDLESHYYGEIFRGVDNPERAVRAATQDLDFFRDLIECTIDGRENDTEPR